MLPQELPNFDKANYSVFLLTIYGKCQILQLVWIKLLGGNNFCSASPVWCMQWQDKIIFYPVHLLLLFWALALRQSERSWIRLHRMLLRKRVNITVNDRTRKYPPGTFHVKMACCFAHRATWWSIMFESLWWTSIWKWKIYDWFIASHLNQMYQICIAHRNVCTLF